MKITAVVVLFNPQSELTQNIMSYVKYVDFLYLIDNSTEYNQALIEKVLALNKNIVYINNNGNKGIANALNQGIDYAQKKQSQWLLTMDQDSRFEDFSAYIHCIKNFTHFEKIAIFAPNIVEETNTTNCEYTFRDIVITSGNIINISYIEDIGQFEEKLFIDEIDHDFCLRISIKGYKIVHFQQQYLIHAIGELTEHTSLILKKKKMKSSHSHHRVYYQTRNRLYMAQNYSKSFSNNFSYSKVLYKVLYKKTFRIIQWEENKLLKLKAILYGVKDFLTNKYGAYDA